MDKNEWRICWYSSLLIAIMINSPKLLALRENGIVAKYWHFDAQEFFFQFILNLAFCYLLFYINLKPTSPLVNFREHHKIAKYLITNLFILIICVLLGGVAQKFLFLSVQLPKIYFVGYFARLALSSILIGIIIKIILLIREGKYKQIENDQLRTAYMTSELELLKEQMNPHFLFNALSSLSGVIREDPKLAQVYVRELSNVFRYALIGNNTNLVTLKEELKVLNSFAQLIYMRLENAFILSIDVKDEFLTSRLPHLSLQPLLENAVKHNAATVSRPLKVSIYVKDNQLVISNSIWEIPTPESSNGLGLINLNERYKIMVQHEITIKKTEEQFIVKLPLKT